MPNVRIEFTKPNAGIETTVPNVAVAGFVMETMQVSPGIDPGMPIGLLLALTYSGYDQLIGQQPNVNIRTNT